MLTSELERKYIHITKDMALEAAKALQQLRTGDLNAFNFVCISGEGATSNPGPFTPLFGRVKGETETGLMKIQSKVANFRLFIVRPSHVDSKGHKAIAPYIPQPTVLLRAANLALGPALRGFFKPYNSPTAPLGEFLVDLATGAQQGRLHGDGVECRGASTIISNVGFRRLMGLS
ncbi:hypothetical protein QC760_010666 [Botrytis cinerea]